MRLLFRIGLALAAVTVVTAAVVSVSAAAQPRKSDAQTREEPRTGAERFEVRVSDEMIRHTRIGNILYFVSLGWSAVMMLGLLATGASAHMRDLAARVTRKPFPAAMLYLALFVIATAVLEFPLSYYAGFVVPHQFALTDQSFGGWMGDVAKGLAVALAILPLLGAGALAVIRRFGNWWAVLWAASIPVIVLLVVIQPIILDPIFNDFKPLQDTVLRQKLLDLASRAGIEGSRVYQVDKSKQTKTMNAYVNGVGPTNRIVMWDTLLAKMDHDEVLGVMGHEMGHYVLDHIWKALAFSVVASFAGFFIAQRIHDPGLRRWGSRWGFSSPGDPASVPWLFLVAGALTFISSPIASGFSRYVEHEADVFALELTHLNEPIATAFRKMAEDSKVDPSPHPLMEYWLYSHPPIAKRIPFALSYKPWEKGEENRVWKP
ncbi:MAG TPA: M48 family metallopeptidase [Thermoanaerobaculia bacterium]|jgi:Zn-dependent protease with chaperone function